MYRQFIPLLLGILFGLSVQAQTNTNRTSRKTTATSNNKTKPATTTKADTTAKKMVVTNVQVKDVEETKPRVTTAPVQAAAPQTAAPVTTALTTAAKEATPDADASSPFKAGSLRVSHQSMISVERYDHKGVSPGKDNNVDATLGLTWFPINGLGIGVDARYNDSYYSTPGTTSDFMSWSTYFHLVYGYAFNERYHAFVKVGYGPAKGDSKTAQGQSKQRLISSFKDLAFSAGAPIRIEKEGRLFVTPVFSYDQYKGMAGTHDIKDKTTGFFMKLESYLPLSAGSTKQPKHYYTRGTQYVDYNSRFDWYSIKREENQGNLMFAPRKYNTRFFHVGYGLYVLDNVAAGLDIEVNHRKDVNPGSSDDIRNSVLLKPSVMAQLPVDGPLNHLFAQVSYELSRGSQTGSVKSRGSVLDLRIGYHLFIAKNIALTPRVGYTIDKYTETFVTSGDNTIKNKGLAGELMLRAWLNWKWMK